MKMIEEEAGLSLKRSTSKRRVMMTADTVGGVWTYAIDLARALSEEGVEILLAAIGPEIDAAQEEEAARIPGLQLRYLQASLEWMRDPWPDVERTRVWLKELEEDFRPEVIHLNQFCYSVAPFRAPTLVVAHSCVFSWYHAVKGEKPGREWDGYRDAVRDGLAAATGVSGISDTLLDGLAEWYGPYRRMASVRNGRSIAAIAHGPKHPYILSAGRVWDEAKNISLLSDISGQLRWPIKIAGSVEGPDDAQPGTLEGLEFLGQLDSEEMKSALQAASLYAAPALYEPFGLAILEAAAAGCALVLADIPSLRDLWEGAAIFVSPRNPQCWATALERLIEDEVAREHMAELARRRALSPEFSPAAMAKGYLRAYEQLLSPRVEAETDKIA